MLPMSIKLLGLLSVRVYAFVISFKRQHNPSRPTIIIIVCRVIMCPRRILKPTQSKWPGNNIRCHAVTGASIHGSHPYI